MSRTTAIDEKFNPAKAKLQWKSELSTFSIYNRETKKNEEVDLPFSFVVLEKDYVSFNGFNEEAFKGFWSNEVKNPSDKVSVRLGNEIVLEFKKGEWNSKDKNKVGFKDHPTLKGCKYTQILYIAAQLPGDDKEEIYRLMLNGGSFTGGIVEDKKTGQKLPGQETDGWINFLNSLGGGKNAVYNYCFTVKSSKSKKNGAVAFTIPIYSADFLEPSQEEHYNEMTKVVNDWFTYYNELPSETAPSKKEEVEEASF